MDKIKEAFLKIRKDIDEIKNALVDYGNAILSLKENIEDLRNQTQNPMDSDNFDTSFDTSTHPSTKNPVFKPIKPKISLISTGNQGVPTDRQTDRQTDTNPIFSSYNPKNESLDKALEILNSLDSVKKEIRLKFKRLTDQEWTVFEAIYSLDEQTGYTNYCVLAEHLNLTESSVRDYVGRLIKKGIPVEKKRINNKTIIISIPENLKNIAPLATISQLRGI